MCSNRGNDEQHVNSGFPSYRTSAFIPTALWRIGTESRGKQMVSPIFAINSKSNSSRRLVRPGSPLWDLPNYKTLVKSQYRQEPAAEPQQPPQSTLLPVPISAASLASVYK
ncbi:hypothetical protein Pelo_13765 [Pelomyxa schiedti]|nr:hypothetical protein Pelo_13765 [Pelomyxa schiedti]